MSDLQKDVEQHRTRLIEALDYAHFARELSIKTVDDLIRSVVEECCKNVCSDCRSGIPFEDAQKTWGVDGYYHKREPALPSRAKYMCKCDASDIRRHFDWLKEGD